VVATLAGTISHVPGGLGVFEGALAVMLPDLGAGPILGALLVFRVFYNLAPLLLAALVLAVFEIILRRRRRRDPPWLVSLGPPLGAALAFGAGAVLLITGAVEAPPALPIWLAEPAQLLSGAAGAVLLAAAWGLLRQNAAAYRLVVVVLGSGAVAALVRGPDWVTAAFLAAAAATIAAAQPLFRGEGGPTEAGLPWGWLGAAAAVLAAALWLTLERQPLGLRVAAHLLAFTADPSARALRAEVVAAAALAAAAAAGRWRGKPGRRGQPGPH